VNSIKIETIKQVKERVEEVLSLLGLQARTNVSAEESQVNIDIETADSALIIGYHGETLVALRHVLALVCREMLPEGVAVRIDVANYLKNREAKIVSMVEEAARKVKKTGEDEALSPMSSYERMLAHQKASEIEGITTHSEGIGEGRRVVLGKAK
jgi:Predicted RNA-binding protein